ncbi:hypothetical protein NEMBOFW57_006637 [Staphylotrichum longicolle]|uniref:Uncharacterized protein n=1 Tax=Staphylotrichum longicolle TaxID=669026 RepID=A0AAD4HWP4_9PEZI|nr:hypothetical protein NEMBOFW57_006637 [Staphylotrichum longicolle]
MPPFLDRAQLQNAIAGRALPALEQLAANPNRLDRSLDNRFERDDPPPYASSSEPECEEALFHPALAHPEKAVLEEFKEVIQIPLSDCESSRLVGTLNAIDLYAPGARYRNESRREHELISSFFIREPHGTRAKEFLKEKRGYQRRSVVVRHAIRKRWQRLGVWNPDWAFPAA